jgi:hypothetical protein
MPPIADATTGRPAVSASATTIPNGSGQIDGATSARQRRIASRTAGLGQSRSSRAPRGSSRGVSGQTLPTSTSGGLVESCR